DLLFSKEGNRFFSHKIFLKVDELPIASTVETIAQKYKDVATIGSYPKINHSYYKTKLTIDSTDKDAAESVLGDLTTALKGVVFFSAKYANI
uniref:FAD synthase middle domain-containing protein n=1 Tax=Plectus sambesii TaxID=2011161 RepID=A0A914UUN8_9BILA